MQFDNFEQEPKDPQISSHNESRVECIIYIYNTGGKQITLKS